MWRSSWAGCVWWRRRRPPRISRAASRPFFYVSPEGAGRSVVRGHLPCLRPPAPLFPLARHKFSAGSGRRGAGRFPRRTSRSIFRQSICTLSLHCHIPPPTLSSGGFPKEHRFALGPAHARPARLRMCTCAFDKLQILQSPIRRLLHAAARPPPKLAEYSNVAFYLKIHRNTVISASAVTSGLRLAGFLSCSGVNSAHRRAKAVLSKPISLKI